MGWSREKTLRYLKVLVLLSLILAGVTIGLIIYAVCNKAEEKIRQLTTSVPYLIATTYGTGYGCIWFRLTQAKNDQFHMFIHSATLLTMIIGHREMFQLFWEGEYTKSYNLFSVSWLAISTYLIQFMFTIYLVTIKYGETRRERSQNVGMHAFLGAIILFICVADGLLQCHRISKDLILENEISFHFATICIFFYGITIWYIMLNPYFDYRRLERTRSRSKSKSESRSQSQSQSRSATPMGRRSSKDISRRSR